MITALALEETRKLPHIQRLKTGYHYFRHRSGVSGRLPGREGSAEYIAQYEKLVAAAERRAPLPPRADGRPVRLPFPVATLGWVARQFMAHDDFRKRRKPGTQVAYRAMIDNLIASDIARIPLAGLNRQHVRQHCNKIEEKRGRSRGDHQAMIISILWNFADNRFPKECKIGEKVNPARSRERTYDLGLASHGRSPFSGGSSRAIRSRRVSKAVRPRRRIISRSPFRCCSTRASGAAMLFECAGRTLSATPRAING
jgi:hypothetical protein